MIDDFWHGTWNGFLDLRLFGILLDTRCRAIEYGSDSLFVLKNWLQRKLTSSGRAQGAQHVL